MGYTKPALILSLITLISACASLHPSRKCLSRITVEQVSSDTAIVTFYENRRTYREYLETDLLYSCALLTTNEGYDYFIIIGGDLSSTPVLHPQPRVLYSQTLGNPYSKGNITYYQTGDIVQDGQSKATAVIQMFKKPRPPRLWYAYDARELMSNLRPPG